MFESIKKFFQPKNVQIIGYVYFDVNSKFYHKNTQIVQPTTIHVYLQEDRYGERSYQWTSPNVNAQLFGKALVDSQMMEWVCGGPTPENTKLYSKPIPYRYMGN